MNVYFVPQIKIAIVLPSFLQTLKEPKETVQQFVMRVCHTTRDSEFGINVNNQNKDAVVRNLHLDGKEKSNKVCYRY